jgi:NADH-quinone oxidoreductase subunit L
MSRLFFMTFHGAKRWTDDQHPHESPLMMTVPMMILAAGSAVLGLVLARGNAFTTWLEPVTGTVAHGEPVLAVPLIMTLTLILVALGIAAAYFQYVSRPVPVAQPRASVLTLAARQDLFQDTVNGALLQWPGQVLTRIAVYADAAAIDGAVNGAASGTARLGDLLRRLQTGKVRSYAAAMLVGVVILLAIIVKGGL